MAGLSLRELGELRDDVATFVVRAVLGLGRRAPPRSCARASRLPIILTRVQTCALALLAPPAWPPPPPPTHTHTHTRRSWTSLTPGAAISGGRSPRSWTTSWQSPPSRKRLTARGALRWVAWAQSQRGWCARQLGRGMQCVCGGVLLLPAACPTRAPPPLPSQHAQRAAPRQVPAARGGVARVHRHGCAGHAGRSARDGGGWACSAYRQARLLRAAPPPGVSLCSQRPPATRRARPPFPPCPPPLRGAHRQDPQRACGAGERDPGSAGFWRGC